jgi:hypothetical protein
MIGRGNRSIRRKPTPVPLCPQIPHAARTRTRTAAVGSQRLTAWGTTRPIRAISSYPVFASYILIILPSAAWCTERSVPFRLSSQNFVCIFRLSHACYMSRPTYSPLRFFGEKYKLWSSSTIQLFSSWCYIILLRATWFRQYCFTSSPQRPDQLWGPTSLLSKRCLGLFSRW